MGKIQEYIFTLSPKKLSIYLVLWPMALFLTHTVIAILFRNPTSTNETMVSGVIGFLSLFLAVFVLIWLFWLRSTVYSVNELQLGIPRKWFQIAYVFTWVFIIFNTGALITESFLIKNEYMYLINASREFINFGGIMIAYPIVCHYAARATMVKRNSKPPTFVNAIPFTLLLIFGTTLGLPFLHKYFSVKNSTNTEVIIVYTIAFGLFIIVLVTGFIAAITGWV